MASLDLERPAIVSLRPAGPGGGRTITVFAGTYGIALMVVAALPFPLRDRAVVETLAERDAPSQGRRAAA